MRIGLIGATGSVGSSLLNLCRSRPDKCQLAFVASAHRSPQLNQLAQEFTTKQWAAEAGEPEQLKEWCLSDQCDCVVFAASGVETAPLLHNVLNAGKNVALANKESALLLGETLSSFVTSGQLRPLDSEHNALWQALRGEKHKDVETLTLTASGGPFFQRSLETFDSITPEDAVRHPVWSMGTKISVDSATMANKGIEALEAACLFGVALEKIDACICPGSAVHGAVGFTDGTVKMIACAPSMSLAAWACLFPDERENPQLGLPLLKLTDMNLKFHAIEQNRYPAYQLARETWNNKERDPLIFLGADEAAVELFMSRQIGFLQIHQVIEETLEGYHGPTPQNLDERSRLIIKAKEAALNRQKRWTL